MKLSSFITNITQIASRSHSDLQDLATSPYHIPSGLIAMWHGTLANIPSGWYLCDGNNGTPNLLDKFVQCVPDAITDPGGTGGTVAKTTNGHNHAVDPSNSWDFSVPQGSLQSATDTISDIRPPYYEVAFIMKS